MAKILIVDDNPDVREVLRCQLEMLGYLVISAENGYMGITKAIAEQPDLILMDIMMPEMDGWQAQQSRDQGHPDSCGHRNVSPCRSQCVPGSGLQRLHCQALHNDRIAAKDWRANHTKLPR